VSTSIGTRSHARQNIEDLVQLLFTRSRPNGKIPLH
jgi:hypothetical protein